MLKTKKTLVIVVTLILVIGVVVVFFIKNRSNNQISNPADQTQGTVNLDPATKEDITRAESNKEAIVQKQEKDKTYQDNQSGSAQSTKPVITYSGVYNGQVEIGGYAPVFEEGAKCTAVFSKGDLKYQKTVDAIRSAQSTDCPAISVPVSDFKQKGRWNVVLSYASSTTTGTSDSKELDIN